VATYQQNIIIAKKDREVLARMIQDEINASLRSLEDFHAKIKTWNLAYEGVLSRKDEPWDDCSNLHIPLTQWQSDATAANIHTTVFGTSPAIHIEPRRGGSVDAAAELEDWLQFQSDGIGLRQAKGKQLSLATTKHGTAIAKLTQDKWQETVRAVKRDNEGISDVVEITRQRQAARLDFVPIRDFVLCPAEALTIKDALGVGDRKRVRLAQVRVWERDGFYEPGTTKALTEEQAAPDEQATETQDEIGVKPSGHESKVLDTYTRWEMIWALPLTRTEKGWKYDPKKGYERDCLITILGTKPIIARCILYPWFHNRRHYIPFRLLPREGEFWGRSVPGLLEHLQDEINTEHNQRADLRTIRLKPPLIAAKGSQIEDEEGKNQIDFGPGRVIWVDSPIKDALEWAKPPQETPSSIQEEAIIVDYSERATTVTDRRLGRGKPGEETLGEVEITEALGNVRFEDMVQTFQGGGDWNEGSGLRELAHQLIGLSLQFAKTEDVYRVLDDEGDFLDKRVPQVEMEDAIGMYDYVPVGNTMTSNRATRQSLAVSLHDRMAQHPLVMNDPVRLWYNAKSLLDAYDVQDWRQRIGSLEDAQQQRDMMVKQMQEEAKRQEAAKAAAGTPTAAAGEYGAADASGAGWG